MESNSRWVAEVSFPLKKNTTLSYSKMDNKRQEIL